MQKHIHHDRTARLTRFSASIVTNPAQEAAAASATTPTMQTSPRLFKDVTLVMSIRGPVAAEMGGSSTAERACTEEKLCMRASAEVLSKASDRFRASLDGGFRESQSKIVPVQLETWEEMEVLCHIVRVMHEAEGGGGYFTDGSGRLLEADEVVAIGLVASDFYLEGCVDECRYWLGDASCGGAADMARFLKSVPEHFYGHEAFDVMMDFASVTGDWFDEASPLHDEFEDSAFLVEPKVFASIEEADREGLLTLRPQLLDLPPYAWAFLVRTAVRGRGLLHGIYMAVRCYLDQSPHCRDLDEAGKKGVFRQVLEGGPLEKLFVINVFLDAVLHSCPYIELVLPLPSLREKILSKEDTPFVHGTFETILHRRDVHRLRDTEGLLYRLGVFAGMPLFLYVGRRHNGCIWMGFYAIVPYAEASFGQTSFDVVISVIADGAGEGEATRVPVFVRVSGEGFLDGREPGFCEREGSRQVKPALNQPPPGPGYYPIQWQQDGTKRYAFSMRLAVTEDEE